MTLYQLKTFVTVARLGSFTLAAETLQVRQPSVSLIMQSLQRELDVRLFERLGNKIHLTHAGEEMLREAEAVVTRAEGIKNRMEEVKGLRKGKISVGGSSIAGASFLPLVVNTFKEQHPGVEATLMIERSKNLEKELLDGELDLAVLGRAPLSPPLVGELYWEDEVVAIASPKHPLAKRHTVPLKLVAQGPLIAHDRENVVRQIVEQRFAEENLPFVTRLEVDVHGIGRDAIKNAVANDLGIGFMAKTFILSDVKAGRLKVLNVSDLRLKRSLFITVHKNRQGSSLIRKFIDLLKRHKQ
jgi:DNA-binding transcriptional LysR family regulator